MLALLGLTVSASKLRADEVSDWQAVLGSEDIVRLQGFVQDYPQSAHLAEAQAMLGKSINTARALGLMPIEAVEGYVQQHNLIVAARMSKAAADYQTYLTVYPQGLFAPLAQSELALLALAPVVEAAPDPMAELAGLTFVTPFPVGEYIKGRSIANLISTATPQFAPIEGLPEEAWKDKSCANCHAWTEASLCDQAKTYTKPDAAEALTKPHPLGETFKIGLKAWALGGCKSQ
ncbi:hypothetical protein [Cypionkella sp.]|uniref:tetratricopeptide repeat protein n=1 Tax=Cypionkella sp. TaxID=2811411 RepID=UPI00261CFA63|nr:hypothetical protein [Cypionkella sp.]MDB5665883.1 peptidase caspase catalytic subunit p20 [Cypionkella sp.]